MALPSACRVVNVSSQTSANGRGKPTTLVVGGCHILQIEPHLAQPVDEGCALIGFSPTANAIRYRHYYSDMYGTVRNSLENWYNPSIRSAVIVLMGSSFSLFLFLNSPDFTNPYYVFGVGVMGFAIVFAALMLISVLLERR